jgi:hypothetical protein
LLTVSAELLRCTAGGAANATHRLDDFVIPEILEGAQADPHELVNVSLESPFEIIQVVQPAGVAADVVSLEAYLNTVLPASKSFLPLVEDLAECATYRKRS